MAMKRCEADLHFYDPAKHPGGCPYCRDQESVGPTKAHTDGIDDEDTRDTVAMGRTRETVPDEEGVTIGVFKKKAGFEPVVGWLVCTEGGSKGKDYRIKPGINQVGRDASQDNQIVIKGDGMISRRDHAEIEYDPEENSFYLIRKRNAAVKLNGQAVRQPAQLNQYDVIQFGESMFVFVPLCSESFKWVIDS